MRDERDPVEDERGRRPTSRHPKRLGAPVRERDEPEPGERRPEETERHEHERRHESPIRTAEQDAPAEERPPTPDEEQGQDIEEMEEPPQAEGPRDTE